MVTRPTKYARSFRFTSRATCAIWKNMCTRKKYGVRTIEDAAHAFPSQTPLGYAGSVADAGVFLFT